MSEKMVKVHISEDVWYPCYDIEEKGEMLYFCEIPEKLYKKYKRVLKKFFEIQKELAELHHEMDSV